MVERSDRLRELVAEVAAAYFSNSHVAQNEISSVIGAIASSLDSVGAEPAMAEDVSSAEPAPPKVMPAQIRKSITRDALISFEDGKGYKTLKRHLTTRGLTPQQYREKWSLPLDYPMTAPSYSEARSRMAKTVGLGRPRRNAQAETATPSTATKKRSGAKGRARASGST